MKKCIVPIFVFVLGSLAQAGPLVPGDIAADAKWFGHVDVAAIRSSDVYAACKDRICRQCGAVECLERFSEATGMNPMKDIQGITAYSTEYKGNAMVVLIYCTEVDPDRLHDFIKKEAPDSRTDELAGHTICRWTCKKTKMPLAGTVAGDGMIVVSTSEDLLGLALRVLAEEKPGLEDGAPLLKGIDVERAFYSVNAIDVPETYQEVTTCPVLRKCTAAFTQWIEEDGRIVVHYRLTANSEEDAENFKAVCDGFRAMMYIKYDDVEAVRTLLSQMQSRVEGKFFLARIQTTEEVIAGVINAMTEKKRFGFGGY